MRLPRTTIGEFYRAIGDAYPRWVKVYFWLIGVPAWLYIAYRVLTAEKFRDDAAGRHCSGGVRQRGGCRDCVPISSLLAERPLNEDSCPLSTHCGHSDAAYNNRMNADEADVVCVGVVHREQVVDWSRGSHVPEPAEWVPESVFSDILKASAEAGVPVLPTLDVYAQTRISAADCKGMLTSWSGLEAALKGTRAEAAAAAMRRLIQLCVDGSQDLELLIEGP